MFSSGPGFPVVVLLRFLLPPPFLFFDFSLLSLSLEIYKREREREYSRAVLSSFLQTLSLFSTKRNVKSLFLFLLLRFPSKKNFISWCRLCSLFRVSNVFFSRSEFWVRWFSFLSGANPRFLHFTLERSTLLLFFFFQRIVTQRKLSVARVVPFLLPFSFLEQTRFRFLEQTT